MIRCHTYDEFTLRFSCSQELVEEINRLGLVDALQKYYNKPLEKEAKSIVAGPSFLQYLNKLFQNSNYQLETSYNLNLEIPANSICSLQLEYGMS